MSQIQTSVQNWNNDLVFSPEEVRDYVGISSLGMPEFFLGLHYLLFNNPIYQLNTMSHPCSRSYLFNRGHKTEEDIFNYLESVGHTITFKQARVCFNGFTGHIDGILDDKYLIDIKCCAPTSIKKIKSNNHIRYETQLACYSEALVNDYVPALLILNSSDCSLHFHEYNFDKDFLDYVQFKTTKIKSLTFIDDLIDLDIVPPREITRGVNKGKLTTPKEYEYHKNLTHLIYKYSPELEIIERQYNFLEIKENIQREFFNYPSNL